MTRMTLADGIPLSFEARIDRARRMLFDAITEMISAHVERQTTGAEWVDQSVSPLGRERHMRLVRTGTLPGKKDGKRILVRRADIEKYLEKKTVIRVDEKADEDREAARILAALGRKRGAEQIPPRARKKS